MDPRQDHYHYRPQHRQLAQTREHEHLRFSWQAPPEEEAPPYEPPQHQPTDQHSRNRAFSYAQTPIEHRDPYYASAINQPPLPTPASNPIDPPPQDTYNHIPDSRTLPRNQLSAPGGHSNVDQKTPLSPVSPLERGQSPPISPNPIVSPELPQPDTSLPQNAHDRKLSHSQRKLGSLSRLNTNLRQQQSLPPMPVMPQAHWQQAGPLPVKSPISNPRADPTSTGAPGPLPEGQDRSKEPYSPHGFPTTPGHAVFSPHAAHGPNGLDFALHQPGQIAHPNMDLSGNGTPHEWKHSLCECSGDCGTCITGLFCPCIIYGRTSYRLNQKSNKKDPTDMLGYSATNGHCGVMGISCGLWWLFPMIQRTRLRHLYKLKGSLGSDILKGCCCCCCVAIQNEREVRDREESSRRWAGPASTDVYTAPGQMMYKPQR
jgi:Cys-rich protein (TIGR01571 family)